MNTDNAIRVVVIGGGYAGTLAANRLRAVPDLDVTLINPRAEFVERIRLHQLVAGNHRATCSYAGLLNSEVRLLVDTAEQIDTAARRVRLRSGRDIGYDYLIYAVGSTSTTPPDTEFGFPIAELEHAMRLRHHLATVAPDAPLVVVGGGLTGVESAAELAEQGRTVTLVCDLLTPSLAASARRSVADRLARLGVNVIEGVTVTSVTAERVSLADGTDLRSAATVWTVGFGVPDLAVNSGLSTDAMGRMRTDETLTSIDDDRIVAAGDCSAPGDLPLRMSCQAALPLGAQAAQTVLARIAGTEPAAISQAFTGQCVSLGRRAGTIGLGHGDDRPRAAYLGGRAGALVKEQVCRMTLSFLRGEARTPGSYRWLKSSWHADRLRSAPPVPAR